MDFCITISDSEVMLDEAIKDPKVKNQILVATKAYLGELYNLLDCPSDVNVSMIFSFQPRSCCICLENCSSSVEITCNCKKKYYHKNCLMEWFQRKKECPTCRKKLHGVGYKNSKIDTPYGTAPKRNSSSKFLYQCEGGTHPKKSSFKSLFSALKHAKEKHNIDISYMTRRGEKLWFCRHDVCLGTGYDFNDEQLLSHLQDFHHLHVISTK